MTLPEGSYFTTQQVAEIVGVSVRTVAAWVDDSKLAAHRTVGGHRRIPRQALIEFMRAAGMPVPVEGGRAPGPPRILVVDDNLEFLDLISEFLETSGFQTRRASSGFSAGLEAARFDPDLVLVDIRMPGMDGFEVARTIRGQRAERQPAVIAMTGFDDPQLDEKGRQAGIAKVLQKPFEFDVLVREIETLLELRVGVGAGGA